MSYRLGVYTVIFRRSNMKKIAPKDEFNNSAIDRQSAP
nr:MAG TPA: hypothetical protein [Caudoviricetes sp.]DAK04383.1 MAG TPA: hypothetical protein [Caudoviricetes sp.]